MGDCYTARNAWAIAPQGLELVVSIWASKIIEPGMPIPAEIKEILRSRLKAVANAPALYRFNGIGTTMAGFYHDPDLRPFYYSLHIFTVLFIPICPLGIYLVSHPPTSKGKEDPCLYKYHAKIGVRDFVRTYPNDLSKLLGTSLLEGLFFLFGIAGVLVLLAFIFAAPRRR